MKFNSLLIAFVLGSIIMLTSCGNDNQDGIVNFSSKMVNNQFATSKVSAPGTINFTTGYVWLTEIVFDADIVGGGSVSRTIPVTSKIDFVTGIADPAIDNVSVPVGDYNSFYMGIELRDEDAQPSVVMEGTYTNSSGSDLPLRFEFNSGEVFEAESEMVTVNAKDVATAYVDFDPSIWFSVISSNRMDAAAVDSLGVIVISSSSNASIFDDVADRLDMSTDATVN